MTVREYIGARYIPLFADPIEWDNTLSYEPLTVVKYQGASYVSRQSVPEGIALDNTDYWILWADYNAQIEAYRREVQAFDGRITDVEEKFPITSADIVDEAITTAKIEPGAVVASKLADNAVTTSKIANGSIITEDLATQAVTAAKIAEGAVTSSRIANNTIESTNMANGAITTAKIADNAVTNSKIADNAVTNTKIANNAVIASKIPNRSIDDIKLSHNEVIVIIGDSWTDPNVPAATWPNTIKTLFNDAELHIYARSGAAHNTGTFEQQYNNFVNDATFDKSTITRCILVYGVNDFSTRPVAYTDEIVAIKAFYDAVIAELPDNVNIHWFINNCYGQKDHPAIAQMEYWHRVTNGLAINTPRLIPHETWSWFNYNHYNQDNFFHLIETVSRGIFAKNIYMCMTGGEPEKFVTYNSSWIKGQNRVQVYFNVETDHVDLDVSWNSIDSVVSMSPPDSAAQSIVPQDTGGILAFGNGVETYAKLRTRGVSTDYIDNFLFVSSPCGSTLADTVLSYHHTFYPAF